MYEHYKSFKDALLSLRDRDEELAKESVLILSINGLEVGAFFNDEFKMVVCNKDFTCFYIPKKDNLLTESMRGEYLNLANFLECLEQSLKKVYREFGFVGTNKTNLSISGMKRNILFTITIYFDNDIR